MMLRGLNRKNRKAVKLMKENGFKINNSITKHYWRNDRKMVFFNTPSYIFKIFDIFPDYEKTSEQYDVKSYGLQNVPMVKDNTMSYIEFK